MDAKLFPVWAGGKAGYVYNVEFEGETIVSRSIDPGFDAARVLHGRGLSGRLRILDGASGAVRFTVGVTRGAELVMREDKRGWYFDKYKPMPLRAKPAWWSK